MGGESALGSPADWVDEIDLKAHGIDELMEDEIRLINGVEKDLKETKEVLKRYAGALQAFFIYYENEVEAGSSTIPDRMRITHFRSLFLDARVTSDNYPVQRLDDCYNQARTVFARRAGQPEDLQMRLPEFLVGTVHVAAGVFRVRTAAALKPADGCTSGAEGYPQLSAKLTHLINDFLLPNLAPALSQRVAALEDALTPETEELLAKGRRLTEQVGWCTGCYIAVLEAENLSDSRGRCTTDNAPFHLYETLDSCQLRRVHREERRLEKCYLAQHMSRWGYVPHKVDETSLAVLTLFAVNQQPDVAHFPVRRHPMDLSYDEFERLLLAVAYHIYVTSGAHKAANDDDVPLLFVEFLGDVLNDIYERAGVLSVHNDRDI